MNESSPTLAGHQDRSTGLLIFGILTILMGAFCALFVVLMIFSQTLAARDPSLSDPRGLVAGIAMYAGLAVAFIWLGIGSIQARRWARALLVILSWGWLLIGLGAMVALVLLLPSMFSKTPPSGAKIDPAMQGVIAAITLGFTGVIFVLIPAVWAIFYSSQNVRATCEQRDPVTRWTDRCPLPVLAAGFWTALGGPTLFLMPLAGTAVFPFFGGFLAGWPAVVLCVVLGLLWLWAAWRLYRLDILGWWIVVASVVLFTISSIMTYSRHTLSELYSLMGYSEAQIAMIQEYSLPQSFMTWGILAWVLPVLGYLLFLRRFFRKA
jgi:uncharacterized membrane protein